MCIRDRSLRSLSLQSPQHSASELLCCATPLSTNNAHQNHEVEHSNVMQWKKRQGRQHHVQKFLLKNANKTLEPARLRKPTNVVNMISTCCHAIHRMSPVEWSRVPFKSHAWNIFCMSKHLTKRNQQVRCEVDSLRDEYAPPYIEINVENLLYNRCFFSFVF